MGKKQKQPSPAEQRIDFTIPERHIPKSGVQASELIFNKPRGMISLSPSVFIQLGFACDSVSTEHMPTPCDLSEFYTSVPFDSSST